jgi:hypothetical protein
MAIVPKTVFLYRFVYIFLILKVSIVHNESSGDFKEKIALLVSKGYKV